MPNIPFDTKKSSFLQTDSEASIPAQTEADDIPPSASPQAQSESAPQSSRLTRTRTVMTCWIFSNLSAANAS